MEFDCSWQKYGCNLQKWEEEKKIKSQNNIKIISKCSPCLLVKRDSCCNDLIHHLLHRLGEPCLPNVL